MAQSEEREEDGDEEEEEVVVVAAVLVDSDSIFTAHRVSGFTRECHMRLRRIELFVLIFVCQDQ